MEARFCGNCGHVLSEPVAPPVASIAAPNPPPAADPVPPPGASIRKNMQTMMGVVPGQLAAPSAPPAPAPPPAQATAAQPVRVAGASRTMIGMVSPVSGGALTPASPPAPAPAPPASEPAVDGPKRVQNAHQTMVGMTSPIVPGSPAAAPSPAAPPVGGARPLNVANAQQTMVGVSSPVSPPHPARSRSERPPMIGGPAPGASPTPLPGSNGFARANNESLDDDALAIVRPRAPRKSVLLAAGAGAIALIGVIALALQFVGSKPAETPLSAEVQPGDRGALTMVVALPGAPAGTTVRYQSQTQTLDAQGRAHFLLGDLGARVGNVDLPLEVTPPGEETQYRTARVVLAYRVEPDLSALGSAQPALRLVFHVVPGSRLLINDQPVTTDPATGVGAATINNVAPIPTGTEALESPFRVQVTAPDGTVAQGVYQLRVPRTPLLVDRPTNATITEFDRVLVRGRATGAQRVTVGSVAATVSENAFTALVPLAPGANHLDVMAYSALGAPALARVDVERSAPNDRAALARFVASNTANVAQSASNAPPMGSRFRARGRVIAPPIEREGTQTFQLLVSDPSCAGGQCIFWVDTVPGTAPAENATVEVAGTLVGRRQWNTANGEHRTDTVVDAAFIQ